VRPHRHLGVLLAVALLVVPVTAVAQDLDGARGAVQRLEGELAATTERYEQVIAEIELTTRELRRLDARAEELEREAARLDESLAERAREVFKHGATSSLEMLLAAEGPDAAVERASLAGLVQARDVVGLEEAVAMRTALEQTVALADQRRDELQALEVEVTAIGARLEAELAQAETRLVSLEALAARQRRVDRGSQQGVYACPLSPSVTSFVDSWGFPRSGGRSHKGTDIMGPMGSPVYAFTAGVIARHSNSRLGGISLYLRGDDGSTYFYTHLQGYAPAGAVGNRVVAGEHIAFNGDTGNARGGAPHIHFERHPGGGAAVNPYPYLAAACF
jgi:peptidoglycan LD-endopeptidase LytH